MATIKPIRTEADHEAALARLHPLMDAEAGTPEGEARQSEQARLRAHGRPV